jgi:hypothetical protein
MMGEQKSEPELFSYAVNLERRMRSDHPLRALAAAIDSKFVRRGGGALLWKQGQCLSRSGGDPKADAANPR